MKSPISNPQRSTCNVQSACSGWWSFSASRRAFTRSNLLLVLVILGILAAVVLVIMAPIVKAKLRGLAEEFSGLTKEANETAAKTWIAGFSTSLDAYEVDTGSYPKGSEGLFALVQAPSDVQSWKGPYMNKIPMDPWGRPYVYVSPGRNNTNSYDIYSLGTDGREGTEDDITNWSKAK